MSDSTSGNMFNLYSVIFDNEIYAKDLKKTSPAHFYQTKATSLQISPPLPPPSLQEPLYTSIMSKLKIYFQIK